jgi:glycosyltransferase involved in cell wall biosynthesis
MSTAEIMTRSEIAISLDHSTGGDRSVPSQASVSFIIPARNEERFLARCLESALAQQLPGDLVQTEIIVVDNESTDRTAEIAVSRGARVVSVPPGSVSRARNAGAAVARGNWLAFIDADCELPADWLSQVLATGDQQEVLAVGTPMAAPGATATWVERTWHDLALKSDDRLTVPVEWLPTFNLLVRADAFQTVGGFDESLVTCEDADLGYRLARHGRLIRNQRTHTIHHGESKSVGEFFQREAWRSRGNLAGALRRGVAPGEWLSLAFPPGAVFCACT